MPDLTGLAVFWGCRALAGDAALELSVRSLLRALELGFEDLQPQACCGEPLRSISMAASAYMAVRIMAQAASAGHDTVLFPCSKGYFMARWALDLISRSGEARDAVSKALSAEGLSLEKLSRPLDLVGLIYEALGPEGLRKKAERLLGLDVALHPGCYLLRNLPGTGEGLERLAEARELLSAVGVRAPSYPGMADCCGGSLHQARPDAALTLAGSKLKSASEAGLGCLVVFCPSCFEMLDLRQDEALSAVGMKKKIPVLYFSQLLGLSLGLGPRELGLGFNRSPVEELGLRRHVSLP